MRTHHLAIAAALSGTFLAAAAAQTAPFKETHPARQDASHMGKWSDDADRLSGPDSPGRDGCPAARLAGPLELASRIGAFEAFIGIRASQFDAWRNYTDALQAMPIGPGSDRRDEDGGTRAAPDLLAQSAALASDRVADVTRAARLLASVEALSQTLTDEQKRRLSEAGPLFPAKCLGRTAEAGSGSVDRESGTNHEEHGVPGR